MRYNKKNVVLWALHRAAAAQMSWTPLICICTAAGPLFQASAEGVLLSVTLYIDLGLVLFAYTGEMSVTSSKRSILL